MCEAVEVDQQHGPEGVDALGNGKVGQAHCIFETMAKALEAGAHVAAVAWAERNARDKNKRSVVAAQGSDDGLFSTT